LFRCIERKESIHVDNDRWINFDSEAYFIIEKKILKKTPVIPIINKVFDFPFISKSFNFNQSAVIDPSISAPALKKINPIISYLIAYFLLGFLMILFLGWTNGSIILLVIAGISFLLNFFSNQYIGFRNTFGVKLPIWNFIGWLLLFFGSLDIASNGFNHINLSVFFIGLSIILWSRNTVLIKRIGQILFWTTLIYSIINSNDYVSSESIKKQKKETKDEEFVEGDNINFEKEKDTVTGEDGSKRINEMLTHTLSWQDNTYRSHKVKIEIKKQDYKSAEIKRNNLSINENSAIRFWHKVYVQLISDNKNYLDQVVRSFANIGKNKNLNRKQFADMVVSGIQNIPYYLVHEFSHNEANKQGGFIAQWHNQGGNCLEKIKFGVQAPTEFMGNFKGDCDTRSVLLFYVLSRLNYDVCIMISERYGHAIIGIAGDYSGDYKIYNGIKYFVWETTATKFVPGVLNPQMDNMNNWEVVLTKN
jgi:hypothetical protein